MVKNTLMTTTMVVTIVMAGGATGFAKEKQPIDVPSQPLSAAIDELGSETGRAIVAESHILHGRTSRAVKGELTAHQALQAMVAGSGLSILELPDRTFALTEAASSQDGEFLLDQVVIEGERSGRTLRETPASVTVLTAEEADQPQNLNNTAVADEIPNVVFSDGDSLLPVVRGIDGSAGQTGGPAITTGAQPRVNVIVDGIARPVNPSGAASTLNSLWDTEQVEVARGPQSTLGGRNSLAGNIRIQTKDPIHDLEGAARGFAFTEQGTFGGAGMLNIPLIEDQVALRLTGEASEGENFIDFISPSVASDILEDEEARRFRGKLLITPDAIPDLEVIATIERNRTFDVAFQQADEGTFENSNAIPGVFDNTQDVFGIKATYEVTDNITLEARGSFLENTLVIPQTTLLGFQEFLQDTDSIAAEGLIRFEDIGFVNRGVFGVTYEEQTEEAAGDSVVFSIEFEGDIESVGIFGEVEFGLTDRLALIAGGRVEIDERSRRVVSGASSGVLDISETTFIPKVGLRYDVSEDVSVGYQYTVGFRPGGLDFDFFDPSTDAVTYGSERLRQHEIYTRSSFLNNRASLNASAFFYTFEDAQVDGAGGISAFGDGLFGNVPEARGFGGEIQGNLELLEGLVANGGIGLVETEITDPGPFLTAFEGSELPRTANVTFNLGLSYVSDLGFDASARVRHVGAVDVVSLGGEPVPSYTIVDLNAGYEFETGDGRSFRIEGFVNNVTDERVILANSGFGLETLGRPRTFGIGGTVKF